MGAGGFTLDELRTAFALRVVHMVMTADEVVQPAEMEFLEGVFPREVIEEQGFLDLSENLFTSRFGKAIAAAPDALASWLGESDKVDLLGLFFKACEADGDVDPRELSVVTQAARMLGLSSDETIRHLSRLLGSRQMARPERRPRSRRPLLAEPLVTTQEALHAALSGTPGEGMDLLRARLEGIVHGQATQLTVVVSPTDARGHVYRGFESLLAYAARGERILSLAGRLDLAFDAWDGSTAVPREMPEVASWMRGLVARYPWIPVWMDPWERTGAQLVAACIPEPIDDPMYAPRFVATAVESANYAVALSRREAAPNLDHVYQFLAEQGITDVPAGYFDGVDTLATHLDATGRLSETKGV